MIRLTFVSSNIRGTPREYETDDLGQALSHAMIEWFGEGPPSEHSSRAWVFSVVIERDGVELTRAQVAQELERTASMELARMAR